MPDMHVVSYCLQMLTWHVVLTATHAYREISGIYCLNGLREIWWYYSSYMPYIWFVVTLLLRHALDAISCLTAMHALHGRAMNVGCHLVSLLL